MRHAVDTRRVEYPGAILSSFRYDTVKIAKRAKYRKRVLYLNTTMDSSPWSNLTRHENLINEFQPCDIFSDSSIGTGGADLLEDGTVSNCEQSASAQREPTEASSSLIMFLMTFE